MNQKGLGSGDSILETLISYLLIVGVILSLILETIGIIMFYHHYGHLNVILQDKEVFIHGQNFFSFLFGLFKGEPTRQIAVLFMTLGVATLILTPYIRVIASAIYFAWKKDIKYVLITTFVLIALTISLILH